MIHFCLWYCSERENVRVSRGILRVDRWCFARFNRNNPRVISIMRIWAVLVMIILVWIPDAFRALRILRLWEWELISECMVVNLRYAFYCVHRVGSSLDYYAGNCVRGGFAGHCMQSIALGFAGIIADLNRASLGFSVGTKASRWSWLHPFVRLLM